MPMEKVAGSTIVTLEGFDPDERERMANTFAAHGALQCGFCTPGILVRTKAMVDKKSDFDYAKAQAELAEAIAQLRTIKKIRETTRR